MNLLYKTTRDGVIEPAYAHDGDAGLDLRTLDGCVLKPLERKLLHTGLAFQVPEGHFGAVVPRSGLAMKRGLGIVNSPGIVDSTYRGEVCVCVVNLSQDDIVIETGERVAQMVIVPYATCSLIRCAVLSDTERGTGGWGSTGTD